jgi:hypothetical protein
MSQDPATSSLSASGSHKYGKLLTVRTTVDIPDPLYRRLKSVAALRGCSVKELVLRGVKTELEGAGEKPRKKRIKLPIIDSRRPGWLQLTNRRINEILFP